MKCPQSVRLGGRIDVVVELCQVLLDRLLSTSRCEADIGYIAWCSLISAKGSVCEMVAEVKMRKDVVVGSGTETRNSVTSWEAMGHPWWADCPGQLRHMLGPPGARWILADTLSSKQRQPIGPSFPLNS